MTASALLASLQETLDARSVAQPLLSRADAAAAAGQAALAEELYAQAAHHRSVARPRATWASPGPARHGLEDQVCRA